MWDVVYAPRTCMDMCMCVFVRVCERLCGCAGVRAIPVLNSGSASDGADSPNLSTFWAAACGPMEPVPHDTQSHDEYAFETCLKSLT